MLNSLIQSIKKSNMEGRRTTIKKLMIGGIAAAVPSTGFTYWKKNKTMNKEMILGHGDFKYRVNENWGNLDPKKFPVNNCHEMVMDSKGRLIMITDEVKNNIIIYDQSGKHLESWGSDWPGGHGLTLQDEGGEDMLYICDPGKGEVTKTDLKGTKIMTLKKPQELGVYDEKMPFLPTETAIHTNGDIYVADGYGSNYILQYDSNGNFIRKFGGGGNNDDQFSTAHGVAIDYRSGKPTLLCTSRGHNSFKRFSMDGQYIETIFLPGAYVCRPVFDGDELYSGVCWSRLKYLNQTDNSGFVTILDKNDKVVSNPGGSAPKYVKGELQLMVQTTPLFKHCHDVCIDGDKNIYICQWNAGKSYPIKLERI